MKQRSASRRAHSAAVLLPLFGVFLLLPPFVTLFATSARPFGVPLIVLYLFGVWALLVAGAALLARRLHADEPLAEPGATNTPMPPEA